MASKDFSKLRPNALIVGLILIGCGIKAGALPVHVWLPLAHPAAPTPASAVLSGTMIKAGLLGWLRFLPSGQMAMPQWGAFCFAAIETNRAIPVCCGEKSSDTTTGTAGYPYASTLA